jgi:hypothetical protein
MCTFIHGLPPLRAKPKHCVRLGSEDTKYKQIFVQAKKKLGK